MVDPITRWLRYAWGPGFILFLWMALGGFILIGAEILL